MINGIFSLLKFALFVVLIPVVVTVTAAFTDSLKGLPGGLEHNFLWGAAAFLVVHLFIVEIAAVHRFGQKLVGDVFRFWTPLSEAAPLLVPVFAFLTLLFFVVTDLIWSVKDLGRYFMFFTGFFLAMHFVFTARGLREGEKGGNLANYYFYLCLIYIVNLLLLALVFDGMFPGFSFPDMVERINAESLQIYGLIFKQLFVPR